MTSQKNSRVFSNTLSLYIRMIVLTVISLFTVRIVLNVLGESDYGLYNVVGGIVTMFSFISGTLIIAAQRYFAYYLSRDDWASINKYFSINIIVNLILVVVLFIIAETIGYWFVLNNLVIPENRIEAAILIYHLSIVTFLMGFLDAPFQALLVADENLGIYSAISILEGAMKILSVCILYFVEGDKLIIYAITQLAIRIFVILSYILYCIYKYSKLKFSFVRDIRSYGEVFAFTNWNLIGAIGSVLKGNGINIIINIFFGTVINAARGIAYQLHTVIVSFSQNFMKAIDPQIIKAYASGEQKRFWNLIYVSSKISYYLLYLIMLPFICNINYVLELWLGNVPDYTSVFTALVLIDALVYAITDPIATGVQAIGKIKYYQIIVGGLSLLNLPVTYIFIKLYRNPLIPFFVGIVISVIMSIARICVFKRLSGFEVSNYIRRVIIPVLMVTAISMTLYTSCINSATNFVQLVTNTLISLGINVPLIIIVGLSRDERKTLFRFLHLVS